MTEQPANYAAISVQDSRMEADVESASSGTYSEAASPYWVPVKKAGEAEPQGFSGPVAFCFTINYILGAGFLTIPWAFVQSGLMLSSIMLIIAAIGSDIAKDFVLETMARAEAMVDEQFHWKDNNNTKEGISAPSGNRINGERVLLKPQREREKLMRRLQEESLKETTAASSSSYQKEYLNDDVSQNRKGNKQDEDNKKFHKSLSLTSFQDVTSNTNKSPLQEQSTNRHMIVIRQKNANQPKYIVKERKFEVNALCRIFLGKRGLRIYTLVISLYMCGALWAYTSVFASAMAIAIPIFSSDQEDIVSEYASHLASSPASLNYLCYAIIFGCIVVPLSCLELDEQVPLQVFLTGCRFLMFFLMIGTSAICADDVSETSAITGTNNEVDNFRFAGIAKTLPILIFANIFHHSIPGLTHPTADKRKVGVVFTSTNVFTVVAYLILGLTLGSTFGKRIEQSSNLNWNSFHANTGHLDEQGNIVGAAWWTKAVSMYIILFPAIDVVSAYPLNAITLGNNLFGAAYGNRIHEVENNRWLKSGFRLLSSIPPIILGIMVRELGVITDYTGTTGFLVGLSFPAILYVSSRAIAKRRHFALDTYYTNYGSSTVIANLILWVGTLMVLGVLVTLMIS